MKWIWASSDGAERLVVHFIHFTPLRGFQDLSVWIGDITRFVVQQGACISGVTMPSAFSGWAGVASSYPTMAGICSGSWLARFPGAPRGWAHWMHRSWPGPWQARSTAASSCCGSFRGICCISCPTAMGGTWQICSGALPSSPVPWLQGRWELCMFSSQVDELTSTKWQVACKSFANF